MFKSLLRSVGSEKRNWWFRFFLLKKIRAYWLSKHWVVNCSFFRTNITEKRFTQGTTANLTWLNSHYEMFQNLTPLTKRLSCFRYWVHNNILPVKTIFLSFSFLFPETREKKPACPQGDGVPSTQEVKAWGRWLWFNQGHRSRGIWRGAACSEKGHGSYICHEDTQESRYAWKGTGWCSLGEDNQPLRLNQANQWITGFSIKILQNWWFIPDANCAILSEAC